jgi:hypothetical protein
MYKNERLKRALEERIYLHPEDPFLSKIHYMFAVQGASGKEYKVNVEKEKDVSCSCPDFLFRNRNQPCKHLLFILIKTLHFAPEKFLHVTLPPVTSEILTACKQYSDKIQHRNQSRELGYRELGCSQKPLDDEGGCPICLEPLVADKKDIILYCKTCGKNIHQDCFQHWGKSTCVYCRSDWIH